MSELEYKCLHSVGFCAFVDILTDAQALVGLASIPVNIFIVILSVKSISSSLARTYALNISATMLVSTVYTFTHVVLALVFSDAPWIDEDKTMTGLVLYMLSDFLASLTFNVYMFQATLTVILAYLACSKPLLAKTLTEPRSIIKYFVVGYFFATLLALSDSFETDEILGSQLRKCSNIAHGVFYLILMALMALFYILALINIIKHANAIRFSSNHCKWAVLKSVLIYCTPPNVFLIVNIPELLCFHFVNNLIFDDPSLMNTCDVVTSLTTTMYYPRIFVTSVTALIAFREYRLAVIKLFRSFYGRFRKNSVISVQPSFSGAQQSRSG